MALSISTSETTTRSIAGIKLGLLALGTAFLAGCAGLTGVKIAADSAVHGASIQVDVVGVTQANSGMIEGAPISKYFQSGSVVRQGAMAKSFRFGGSQPTIQLVDKTDPIWARWKAEHVTSLVVLADVPGVFEDLPGDADPRRKILPLTGKTAPKGVAELEITQGGLRLVPPAH